MKAQNGEKTATECSRRRAVAEMRPGERRTVCAVSGRGAVRQRLLDLGILPEREIVVERVAPAGNPIWVSLRGLHISLRRKEALCVQVASI